VPLLVSLVLILAFLVTGCDGTGRAEAPRERLTQLVWSGAVTPTSATVRAKLLHASDRVRLLVSPRADLGGAISFGSLEAGAPAASNVVSFTVSGLLPDTVYHYAVEAEGRIDPARGRFHTFPDRPASFRMAFASCADTGSNHPVFDTIRRLEPLFFLHMGDFHYEDIAKPEPRAYRRAYEAVFASPRQSLLYRSVPIVYMWDDHDFGGDNSDGTNPGRTAARRTYEEYVPHYPLPAGGGPIYQAFTVGRIRFLVTDLRSARSPARSADDAGKTMMGAAQKVWFERELLAAYRAGMLVAWVNTDPWIEKKTPGSDRWGGYSTERREIADFIAGHRVDRLVMLSGDAHMLALDDGSHTDYSTRGGAAFPLMHAAALDRRGSVKGGPYTQGPFPSRTRFDRHDGQFGLMEVRDQGGAEICIEWSGRRQQLRTSTVVELIHWERCFAAPPAQVTPSPGPF
jgi:alkaline phosphatase D